MLSAYLQRTQALLSDLKQELYTFGLLTSFVNTARGQLAGESECIRVNGLISTVIGSRSYNFSDINVAAGSFTGVGGVIHVRSVRYLVTGTLSVNGAYKRINPRPWEWFELYHLNNPVPPSGVPTTWSQYAQGSAGTSTGSTATGSFFVDPLPDLPYTLVCDCVCYPFALTDDSSTEAIPYLWTDAVPYFTAYLAYQYAQKMEAASRMLELYNEFSQRARRFSNPAVNRYMYQQAPDLPSYNKLGIQKVTQQ